MKADFLLDVLKERGFGLFSGVPCSYLTSLINAAIDSPDIRYVNAANEGEAVAICSGAQLGGVRAVAMFQNSGLGNAVSPLTSLNAIFRIPILLICTWRGQVGGAPDEPQHSLMGRIMPELLHTMEIPYSICPSRDDQLRRVLADAVESMDRSGIPYALLMQKETLEAQTLRSSPPARQWQLPSVASVPQEPVDVDECLSIIACRAGQAGAAVLATTGFTGRALYAVEDRENHFYMVGSMGCVSSLGLGLALVCRERQVVAIDGDGSLLMRMGSLAAVGAERPQNFTHIVLDNGVHDSTGAQSTLSHTVDIPRVAAACGYPQIEVADSIKNLDDLLSKPTDSLRLIYVRTLPRKDRKLPRPCISPAEVATRMRSWLRGK